MPSPKPKAPLRISPSGRKRTKTFTGCWTCRARKIKCDEARPHCRQCRDKSLACEGYGSRLQWLAPETGSRAGSRSEMPSLNPSSTSKALRRHIPAEPPKSVLTWNQVDGILRVIDSLESGWALSQAENACASIQHFGVFALDRPSPSAASPSTQRIDSTDNAFLGGDDGAFDFTTNPLPPDSLPPDPHSTRFLEPLDSIESFASPSYSETAAAWDLCNLHTDQSHLQSLGFTPDQHDTAPDDVVFSDALSHVAQPQQETPPLASDAKLIKQSTPGESWHLVPNPQFQSIVPNVISTQERFLMGHYMNRVINLFCVIDNGKSPWKTIHLPKVLQGAGELSFTSQTTRIRNALRNALLSVSAFYLSNDHHTSRRRDEAKKWGDVASQYRYEAIGLLKEGVETDLYTKERPKYKEFLATMLSMVTINVMSGDTSTCGVHLDGAEQLMNHMSLRKAKFSRKAHALHRIYLYLRVIYESTAVKRKSSGGSRFSPFVSSRRSMGTDQPAARKRLLIDDEDSPSSMVPMESDIGPFLDPGSEMAAYECIYGIPQSLLLMLKEAIEVIDQVDHERAESGTVRISESLETLCDQLEKDILDWPLEERLKRCRETNKGISAKIIYHQTRAFHNALIIYFSQNVRLLGHRYLRHYVETILDSIEAVERIKLETKTLAAPLFWPAFIGATEAFEPPHQDRFRTWYGGVDVYGIEAVRTGIQVVHEVWRRGPAPSSQAMSSWRAVILGTGDSLMLT
ncbi:fungal-specific transcription factor domain-containing protein [Dactylonectria estremocensis]|uniref:Fungal-specific transcription factor domain-containing protein n=1 Tax=Dactylonectria estremocensis TaxID=1079267 RepID=A0A9P9FCB0_9HYPO|nr:fungal-specific transcription factor domain-containing protein [Dactylonectria estremocensis]